eukprot:c16815_g1_i2 orf=193-723(+)
MSSPTNFAGAAKASAYHHSFEVGSKHIVTRPCAAAFADSLFLTSTAATAMDLPTRKTLASNSTSSFTGVPEIYDMLMSVTDPSEVPVTLLIAAQPRISTRAPIAPPCNVLYLFCTTRTSHKHQPLFLYKACLCLCHVLSKNNTSLLAIEHSKQTQNTRIEQHLMMSVHVTMMLLLH